MRMANPFEPLPPHRLAAIYQWPQEALRFLDGTAECLHVLGSCGMGKTALLLQLGQSLAQAQVAAPYTCFPVGAPLTPEAVELGQVALLDEVDRLPRSVLAGLLTRVRRAHTRVVLATHRDLRRRIRGARLSCLHVPLPPLTTPAQVMRLLSARAALAGPAARDRCHLLPEAAAAVLQASAGNLERCLQLGYELFEDADGSRPLTADDVAAAAQSLSRALQAGAE